MTSSVVQPANQKRRISTLRALMMGSLVVTGIMTALVFYVLNDIASKEETFLRSEFGAPCDAYAATTPKPWLGYPES